MRHQPMLIVGLALILGLSLVIVDRTPAAAMTCPRYLDCSWPDTMACDGANSTVRTKWTWAGTVELRYDSGCRTIWARIGSDRNEYFSEVQTKRVTGPSGDTFGGTMLSGWPYLWSRQLDDAGFTGKAGLKDSQGTWFWTTAY